MYKLFKLNLGRNALRCIIQTFQIKEIFIPYYLCSVIRQSIIKEKCKISFYHIDETFYPIGDFPVNAYILYPNYFGICDINVDKLAKIYPNLIVDNAHACFNEPKGIACFNSARKFFNTYNGSFLWIKKNIPLYQEEEFFAPPKNEQEFLQNEISFSNCKIKLLNNIYSIKLGKNFDTKNREIKFDKYHNELKSNNQLSLNKRKINSPFCYPYLAKTEEEANELVKTYQNNGEIIYRYWEKIPKTFFEYIFYTRLVALPLPKMDL